MAVSCCRYVSGRVRPAGEINGKSGNLNNCLRNVIYVNYLQSLTATTSTSATATTSTTATISTMASSTQQSSRGRADRLDVCSTAASIGSSTRRGSKLTGPAADIPKQEVVVVFDADMVCKTNFFRHVSGSACWAQPGYRAAPVCSSCCCAE